MQIKEISFICAKQIAGSFVNICKLTIHIYPGYCISGFIYRKLC